MSSIITALLYGGLAVAQDPYGNVTNPTFSYEVTVPLPDYGNPCATQILVNQEFANSYGKPAYIHYSPPAECPEFTHVTADLYFATYGYQYDRLMHFLKDGIEVWRPSTPEPVGHNVTSKESKDLSTFTNLFKTEGLVEFSLDNLLAGFNQGAYYTELKLTFYNINETEFEAEPGVPGPLDDTNWFYEDVPTNFYAVVANQSTIYKTPATGSIPQVPRNTTRAVLNVLASGNSNEEFWYTNDLSGDGGTRLVKVFIDNQLAGFADPFPIVYTGGLNPGLWQPLLGLKASDVPAYIIDVSPFLPQLWDHATSVQVAVGDGYNDTQGIQSNWIIDASLLTWESPNVEGSGSALQATSKGNGWPIVDFQNATYEREGGFYTQNVKNSALLDFVDTASQTKLWSGEVSWSQFSRMLNHLNESELDLFVHQHGEGWSRSVWQPVNGSAPIAYERSHYYPIDVSLVQLPNNSYELVSVNRSFDVNVTNNAHTFSETIVQESVYDNHEYTSTNDIYLENYHRHAVAVNGKVVEDTNPPSQD